MSANDLSGTTAVVTGASRGFGRSIAISLAKAGASVVAIGRDASQLAALAAELGGACTPVSADVTDPVLAGQLLDTYSPGLLVLTAGASPLSRPLQQHTWQTFSRNWEVDVQQVFHWTREALLQPLRPGSTVIAFSSGAALRGSPLSGGYAGAKATIRFIAGYAAEESDRAGLGIRFVSVLPQLTAATGLGELAVAGYAARAGLDVATYKQQFGPMLTAEQVGEAVTTIATDGGYDKGGYVLTAAGLSPAP